MDRIKTKKICRNIKTLDRSVRNSGRIVYDMIRTKDKADAGRPEADVSVIYTDKMKKAALKEAQNYRSDTLALYEEMLYNQCICGKAMDRQKDGKGEYSYENGEAHGEGAAMAVHKISHIA